MRIMLPTVYTLLLRLQKRTKVRIERIRGLIRVKLSFLLFASLCLSSQDLGLQGTSLNDILYKNASFLNLVDPISHELLLSLARDLQCPKRVRSLDDRISFSCL